MARMIGVSAIKEVGPEPFQIQTPLLIVIWS